MVDAPPRDPSLDLVARYFQARTGVFVARAERHAHDAIVRAMRDAGYADPHAYVAALDRDPRVFDALVARLTVGESYFFRDEWHFDLVIERVLPEVRARVAAGGPGLRAWSAGCAAGEELSSLAMALAEQDALAGAWLLGTDVSAAALARARAGRYRGWSLRGRAAERAKRWMHREGELWRLDARIRRATTYRPLNLAGDLYPSPTDGTADLDVIFCRNVLIYLDDATIGAVAPRLHASLRPGGWLLAGPSDPPLSDRCDLVPVVLERGVVYQRRGGVPRSRPPSPPSRIAPKPAPGASPAPAGGARRERPHGDVLATAALDRLRRMAALDPRLALAGVDDLLASDPKNRPAAMLRATLLVSVDRPREAEATLRAMLDHDPDIALAAFMLASLRLREGDLDGARAGWERALALADRLPPGATVPYSDDEPAARLADAARRQLALLDAPEAT